MKFLKQLILMSNILNFLKTIQKLNLQNLDEYRVENKLSKAQPEEEEGYNSESSRNLSPPKEYHVETDINEINTQKI